MCIYSFFNHLFVVFFFFFICVCTNKNSKLFKKKFNSKFMNIYEKEIYSNLILLLNISHFIKKNICI